MISERISLLRSRIGFTQADLARELNTTRSSVNAWEMGISMPSTQNIVEIANLFKVSTDYIYGIDSTNSINIDSLNEDEKAVILDLIRYFNNNKRQ